MEKRTESQPLLSLQCLPYIERADVFGIVPSVPTMASHESEFADLHRELEEMVSKVKTTLDGEDRRQLLREMRRLLTRAERSSS